MNQLIWGARGLEVFVIEVAARRWIYACIVQVSISLKLVQGLEYLLSVLCANPRHSIQKVLIDVTSIEKRCEVSHLSSWVRSLQPIACPFKIVCIFIALWVDLIHLNESQALSTRMVTVCIDTPCPESLSSSHCAHILPTFLRVPFDANNIESVD